MDLQPLKKKLQTRVYIIRLKWHLLKIKCTWNDYDDVQYVRKRPISAPMIQVDGMEEVYNKEAEEEQENPLGMIWDIMTLQMVWP